MILKDLNVQNYRNITQAHLEPGRELTVICGENGQGKTNLLESVWLLTGGKSFRGAKDSELVKEESEISILESIVQDSTQEKHVRICIADNKAGKKTRTAKVNDISYGRASSIAGVFSAVVFDPGHLSLVKGSPEGRRKFIDAALCQLYPGYLSFFRQYTRLLTQKNALLKKYEITADANSLLDIFDEKIVEIGQYISFKRQEYLLKIAPHMIDTYHDISGGRETLNITYEPCFDEKTPLEVVIRNTRARDIAARFCTAGPHKEDFKIEINGKSARTYASQGQQRSAVLSLKLAEAAGAHKIIGEHPVMLLDDVLSELDEIRQSYLLSRMEHRQTIVTSCDASLFQKTDGKIYYMSQGILTQ